jgi:hypothetical protein
MIRLFCGTVCLHALFTAAVFAQAEERLPLQDLLTARDFRKFSLEDKYHNRIKILRKTFEAKVRILRRNVQQRDVAGSFRSLAELRGLAFHGLQDSLAETNEKEQRHKEVKNFEIRLRKFTEEVEDLKLSVPLEDRYQFEMTSELVEELRDQLLKQLFGRVITASDSSGMALHSFAFTASAGALTAQGLRDLDRFTEEEFSKLQLAQQLVKRVEVFLEIAESRLDEIERRVKGVEWKEKEPNPLEFYSYEEMLHAYTRAIEGVMVNIDEKATSGMAREQDIRKSLKELSKKIEDFTPRLEALKALVMERRDERLARKLMDAMKASEIARKGAQYGLGAPERK